MLWPITIKLSISENAQNIINNLYHHHCISSIVEVAEGKKLSKDGDHSENEPDSNMKQYICKAIVHHIVEEKGLENFLMRTEGVKVDKFIPIGKREKIKEILHEIKFSSFIVFIVVFGHESLMIIFKDHGDPWISAGLVSLVAALVVLGVDSARIWQKHHY